MNRIHPELKNPAGNIQSGLEQHLIRAVNSIYWAQFNLSRLRRSYNSGRQAVNDQNWLM
jgi:hypothetical protein